MNDKDKLILTEIYLDGGKILSCTEEAPSALCNEASNRIFRCYYRDGVKQGWRYVNPCLQHLQCYSSWEEVFELKQTKEK